MPILPSILTLAASSLEGVFWLVSILIWVVIQLLQRSVKKDQPTPGAPTLPGLPGDTGNRDFDDFLTEMLERAAPEIKPAPAPDMPRPTPQPQPRWAPSNAGDAHKKPPKAVTAHRVAAPDAIPIAPIPEPAVRRSKPRRVTRKPAPKKAHAQPALVMQGLHAGAFLRNAALPAMPAMQPRPLAENPPNVLTATLKSTPGMRRAFLWSEIVAQPRALRPY